MSIGTIRTGMATRLATISGLRAASTWPDVINPPLALVEAPSGIYHTTFETAETTYQLDVVILVSMTGGLSRAQDALEPYISPSGASSLRVAVEGDSSLGGAAEYAVALGFDKPAVLIVNDVEFFGTTVHFEVQAA